MVEQRSALLDAAYGALADATRRAILNAVSKHVQMLERAGLVRREIRGRNHFLIAEPAALLPARDWIDHYQDFWASRADALAAHLAKRTTS
jgi:DNA-binding transcriptional ArsR family regulator